MLAQLPEQTVYKHDRRSRVWLTCYKNKYYVIKRFEYLPIRQILGACIGLHPGQLETRKSRRLHRKSLPVERVLAFKLIKGRAHLLTAYAGNQVSNCFTSSQFNDYQYRKLLVFAVCKSVKRLLDSGYVFRDCKLSNMVQSKPGKSVRFIDVGSIKRNRSRHRFLHMLRILDETAFNAGLTRHERFRGAQKLGLNKQDILDIMKK